MLVCLTYHKGQYISMKYKFGKFTANSTDSKITVNC